MTETAADDLYRLVVRNAVDFAIFTTDRDGRILTWNPGAEQILGYAEAEAVGRSSDMIFAPEDREAGAPLLERELALKAGRAEDERWHTRRDGTRFWGAGVLIALRNDAGEHVGYAKLVRDLTRRRLLQTAQLQAQRMETVGVLAGGIAHQFNNQLTTLLGNLDLAARKLSLLADPDARQLLAAARNAGDNLAHLTQQLLAFAGRARTAFQPFDICREIRDAVELLGHRIPRHIVLEVVAADRCPAVHGDPSQLRQVIDALLVNAAEAIGGRPGTVRLRATPHEVSSAEAEAVYHGFALRPGSYVRVEVVDDGPGMPPEVQARVFEPFFTTRFPGRGLGLAAAMGVVRVHEGAITVRSTPGMGTAFEVLLPTADRASAEASAEASAASRLALVVDDDELIRSLVGAVLETQGFTVLHAENGEQAARMVERVGGRLSVVLLDLAMPVRSARDTLDDIRRCRPDLPVVAMTGLAPADVERELEGAAVEGLLPKPFTFDQLLEAVHAAAHP